MKNYIPNSRLFLIIHRAILAMPLVTILAGTSAWGQSFLLPGRPSPVVLRGWDSGDTTVIELEDYLTKASAVKEVMVQTGWQQQKSSDGKQLLLFRNSTAKSPPYKTLKPEGTETSKEGAAGRVSSVQVLDIQDPALVPLWPLTLVLKNGEVLDIPVKAPLLREALFRYKPAQGEKVESVAVAGDFNGWSEKNHPMAYVADAQEWQLRLKLAAGSYPYQLVVNGKWMLDPAQAKTRDNGLGGINSLLRLMPEGDDAPALDLVQANEDQVQLVWAGRPAGVLVFWENMLIMRVEPGRSPKELVVKAPKEATRQARSFLRIYTYNAKVPGNDLLIPLFKGKVVQNAKDLTRQDAEAQRMYFVFVDRFANGDTTNDQRVDHPEVHPKANYWGGDLQGVLNKIQEGYFDRLGINSLWLSPIVQNPLGPYREWPKPNRMYSGYHGYWPISSSRVDRRFGDEALLRKLIDTAHAHGINVLLDYVANHVHQEHPLLKEHPDWITTLDLPDGRKNIRIWDEHRLTTWFDTFMPSLDLERPEVYRTMSDSALYWLEQFSLDGFRHDATKHIPEVFWRTLTRKIKERIVGPQQRSIYQIGETFGSRQLIGSYIGSGMIDAQFDFNLYFDARSALASDRSDLSMLRQSLEESFLFYGHQHSMGNISGNHDMPRFIAYASGALRFDEDPIAAGWDRAVEIQDTLGYRRLQMLQTFIMTIPGVPVLYYGDEIGMVGAGDPDNRRPMVFQGLNPHEEQTRRHCQRLLELRASSMALQYGSTHFLHDQDQVLVMSRRYLQEDCWVAINRSPQPAVVTIQLKDLPDSAVKLRNRPASLIKLLGQASAQYLGKGLYRLEIPPYASAVWAHP